MRKQNRKDGPLFPALAMSLAAVAAMLALAMPAEAGRPHGSGGVRATASGNVNHAPAGNRNVNRDVNRNRNVNRDVDVHRDIDVDVHGGCCYHDHWDDHPVATAAAVTAAVSVTAAAIGSIVYSIPPSCSQVVVNGIAYQQCGSTWYQPQYAGTTVQYVVVNAP